MLLSSNSGRAIAAQLRDGLRSPGIVAELTRCLVNLWAPEHLVPPVLPLPPPPPPLGLPRGTAHSHSHLPHGRAAAAARLPPLEVRAGGLRCYALQC